MKLKPEDWVVITLVLIGLLGGLGAAYMKMQPVLVAVLLALGIAAAIFRFLGGVEGASLKTGTLRLGGSAAVFLIIAWFVNQNLVVQTEIKPSPETWLALDHQQGIPVSVSVAGVERIAVPDPDVLIDHEWKAKLRPQGLRLLSKAVKTGEADADDEFVLGHVASSTLQALHLFNTLDPRTLRFTRPLNAGTQGIDLKPYPFVLNVGSFEDGLSSYELFSDSTKVAGGSLRNKDGEILHIGRQVFLLMTVAANHAPHTLGEEDKEPIKPWVRFGFVELLPRLETNVEGNPSVPISRTESTHVDRFVTDVRAAGSRQKGI